MKGLINRKKKGYGKTVAAGFIGLYLVTMGLVTGLVKGKYIDEYDHFLEEAASSVLKSVDASAWAADDEGWDEQRQREAYQHAVNEYFWNTLNLSSYPQISAAVYDKNQKLLAQSGDAFGKSYGDAYVLYMLDDYLSFEDKETLAKYYWEGIQSTANHALPEEYRISIRTSQDASRLQNIYVQQLVWEERGDEEEEDGEQYIDPLLQAEGCVEISGKTDYATGAETQGKTFYETDSKIVWEWANPEGEGQPEKGEVQDIFPVVFPYMNAYEDWHKWSSSAYLHGFPKYGDFTWKKGQESPDIKVDSDLLYYKSSYPLKVGPIDNPLAYLEIRMEVCPWAAALNYMKYAYLAGIVLTLACMFLVLYVFNQTDQRQKALEQTRRDITNAMAHELKTPLGIIRNFAENLLEHTMEEKREYYLSQIIGQTEEMDHLVVEMIGISKLDSEELVLKKESVSLAELVHEQMERFEPLIREKNLQIQYLQTTDFLIDGDREYLAKAIWNLLSNAVDYNVPKGRIRINIEKERCCIENTGTPLEEEQLCHVFDLFYTGDKRRDKQEKHRGLGLFLAKKIFTLHHMGLALENTDDGIQAVIRKNE